MTRPPFLLRDLSVQLRIAVTCLVLILLGGYAASLYFLTVHISPRDGDPALSLQDLEATYHGIDRPAGIQVALDDSDHRSDYLKAAPDAELDLLRAWVAQSANVVPGSVDPVEQGYDYLPEDAPEETLTPADVLDTHCVRCHAPSAPDGDAASRSVSLKGWPDVRRHAYAKKVEPQPITILAQSTHAHALSIPVFTLIAAALLLATCYSRRFRHGLVMLCFLGLLLDFAGMWLGRYDPLFVFIGVLGGGALYGITLCVALGATLLSMWFGRGTDGTKDNGH
jgi:hypothetical protein